MIKKWDNIRYFLAVSNAKSVAKAAKILGVNHATVIRRISELETQLGTELFSRTATGYRLTEVGERIHTISLSMNNVVDAICNAASEGIDEAEMVQIKLTVPQAPLFDITSDIASLNTQVNNVSFQISYEARLQSIDSFESDVAVRLTSSPPEELIGYKLGQVTFKPFIAQSLYEEGKSIDDYPWVRWSVSMWDNSFDVLAESLGLNITTNVITNKMEMALELVSSGAGVCFLPVHYVATHSNLKMIENSRLSIDIDAWLLRKNTIYKKRGVAELFRSLKKSLPLQLTCN